MYGSRSKILGSSMDEDTDDEKSNKGKWIAVIIALLLVGGAIYYFTQKKPDGQAAGAGAAQMQMPPAPVTVIEVESKDLPLNLEYAGRTAGSKEVEIRARVGGILIKRSYTEGQAVKAGQLLFKIDPAPFEAAFSQAQAKFTQTENDWKRVSDLYKEKAVSDREYDEAQAAYKAADADLKTAKINLGYTTVIAPISGVTSKESMSEGSLVQADQSLLTRVSVLDPLYVNFAYPDSEESSRRLKISQGKITLPDDKKLFAEIHFGNGVIYDKLGIIDFTDSIIDTQTGTVHARAVVPNPDGSVLPGDFVRVVVKGFTAKNVIIVPDQAVMQSPQGQFVYTVTADGKAAMTPVVIGDLVGENRIIDKGLKNGDRVITEGMIKVRPDAPVNVTQPSAQNANAPEAATPPAEGK